MIKLKPSKAKTYSGHARYDVVYDHDSGMPNRYTVLLDNATRPIVIGRELDLKTVLMVIGKHEEEFSKEIFFGNYGHALRVHKAVVKKLRNAKR